MSLPGEPPPHPPEARLAALLRRAELTLLWERLWPPLASAGAVVALFLAAAWAGVEFFLPYYIRLAGLLVFAFGLGAALFPLRRLRWPRHEEALTRLDRDAPDRHRPASAFEDRLAGDASDPVTSALWAAHRARVAREIGELAVAPPAPGLALLDRRALRFAALLLAVAAFLAAGPERYARFLAAFDFRGLSAASAPDRADAWIDPPAYADQPPIVLALGDGAESGAVDAPENSTVVLCAESDAFTAATEGAIVPLPEQKKPLVGVDRRFALHGDGVFRVLRGGATVKTFRIHALATPAPTIALIEPPQRNLSGSLTLHYRVSGATRIVQARGAFDLPAGAAHRLVDPPKFALVLPPSADGTGEGRATVDVSESPWAGAEGELTLSVSDAAGKTGATAPLKFQLPVRPFAKPLARALVEQRRKLTLDPDAHKPKLAAVLAALQLAPDQFGTTPSVYLGLHAAESRLARAHNDKALLEVADLLWAMALQIEDGDAPRALQDFRAAQEKLREALKNGASEEEIRRLTKELREAAERALQEIARGADKTAPDDNALASQDLDAMLDRLEDSARNGARDDAEAMLDELQNLFENLRAAPSPGEAAAERELRRQMSELDKLMREQQALRDDTFRGDERDRARGEAPDATPENDPGLTARQRDLAERLQQLEKAMKGLGLKPEPGFGEAEGAMREAEGDLQPGGHGKGPAVGAQGRALESLRKGMQGMQQQLQAGAGGKRLGGRPGPGNPLGRYGRGDKGDDYGPLNHGPEAAARARRVLEELRRRLADPNRPTEERDYLERLTKPD